MELVSYKCCLIVWIVRLNPNDVFYNVARIIKLKMKHVICYAGAIHTRNMAFILSELNFNLAHVVDGVCI